MKAQEFKKGDFVKVLRDTYRNIPIYSAIGNVYEVTGDTTGEYVQLYIGGGNGYRLFKKKNVELEIETESVVKSPMVTLENIVVQVLDDTEVDPADLMTALEVAINKQMDQRAIINMAKKCGKKLEIQRQKGYKSWYDKDLCTAGELSQALREAVKKGDPVDVANYCAMLLERGEQII